MGDKKLKSMSGDSLTFRLLGNEYERLHSKYTMLSYLCVFPGIFALWLGIHYGRSIYFIAALLLFVFTTVFGLLGSKNCSNAEYCYEKVHELSVKSSKKIYYER